MRVTRVPQSEGWSIWSAWPDGLHANGVARRKDVSSSYSPRLSLEDAARTVLDQLPPTPPAPETRTEAGA